MTLNKTHKSDLALIEAVTEKKWNLVKKIIKSDDIDWNLRIDPVNGVIHCLAYYQPVLLKYIKSDILPDLIGQPNSEGDTIAHIAAKLHNIKLLTWCTKQNLQVIYQLNTLGFAPLYYIINQLPDLEMIIQTQTIMDHHISRDYTLLEYIVLHIKSVKIIKFFVTNVKLSSVSKGLMCATIDSDLTNQQKIKILEILHKHGLSFSELDSQFVSPLIVSVSKGYLDITEFLLDNGADINYAGPEQNYHLVTIAVENTDTKMIKLFIRYKPNLDMVNKHLQTPLHILFSRTHTDIPLKLKMKLLNLCDDINRLDSNLDSILRLLILNDNWKNYISILQTHHLDIYTPNKDQSRPIDLVSDSDFNLFIETVITSYIHQVNSLQTLTDPLDIKIKDLLEKNKAINSDLRSEIKTRILKGKTKPTTAGRSNTLKIISAPHSNITHFSAYTYNYICYLYYLLNKYPDIKVPSVPPNQMLNKTLNDLYAELTTDLTLTDQTDLIFRSIIKDYINHSPILINHLIIWKNSERYFFSPYIVQGIHQILKSYPQTKFILLKLSIITNQKFNHANIIIYDVPNKVFERFDPYGKVPFVDNEGIDNILSNFVLDYFPECIYMSPINIINNISFQVFSDEASINTFVENDPAGFCVAWCLWYVEMRYKNMEMSPSKLISSTISHLNKSVDNFKSYIRNYSNILDHEKNIILKAGGIPKQYWYKKQIPTDMYLSYLKYIRRIFHNVLN